MNRSKLTRLVLTLGAVALLSGCNTVYEDKRGWDADYYAMESENRPFLGVLVPNHLNVNGNGRSMTVDEGIRIERVLAESPAAKAGLSSGDRIVRYGVHRIRSVSDLTKAILEIGADGAGVEVALRAHPQSPIRVVTIKPEEEWRFAAVANKAIKASEASDGTYLHFFIQTWDRTLSAETWLAYQGFRLPEGARLHGGFAIFPLAPDMFSLFSVEDTDIFCDASRVSLLGFPLQLNLGGGPDEDLASAYAAFRNTHDRL